MTESHNQEELNKALNIYIRAMCDFIFEYLKKKVRGETVEDLIRKVVNREPFDLEPKHILQIFRHRESRDFFKDRFGYNPRTGQDKYDIESVTALIVMGRNKVHHVGSVDLDSEFTRTCLFLIADVLGEINRPDAKEAVETIRDQLFSDESEEHPLEAENAAYKKQIADIIKQRDAAKAEKTELEKQVKTTSDRLAEVEAEWIACDERLATISFQLEMAVAGKTVAEERLSGISNRLEDAEVEKTELEKRLKTMSDRLKDVEKENAAYQKRVETISNQLEKAKAELDAFKERPAPLEPKEPLRLNPNTPDSVTFHGTIFTKHLNQYLCYGDDISQDFWHYWQSQGREGKQKMRDAGWSVEKVDGEWEVIVSPEDFQAWIANEMTELSDLLNSLQNKEPSTQPPRPFYGKREANNLDDRKEIGRKVAELRINSAGSKPMSWRRIREKLRIKNDEFHKGIRLEDHFRESVVERIESFEGGWEYRGKLKSLLGFEPVGELKSRIEACKPKPVPKEEAEEVEEPQGTVLPTGKEMEQPALEFLSDGREYPRIEIINVLTQHFSLTKNQREQLSRSGRVELYLRNKELVERTRTGYYRITDLGLEILKRNSGDVPF